VIGRAFVRTGEDGEELLWGWDKPLQVWVGMGIESMRKQWG